MSLSKFENEIPAKKKHFGDSSETEMQQILEDRNAKATVRATKSKVRGFNSYLQEKNIAQDESEISDELLPEILQQFYANMRKEDSSHYKNATLKTFRAGLNRHFKETQDLDIVSDSRFRAANKMFDAVKVKGKRES